MGIVALYERLSKDDLQGESNSISTQKNIRRICKVKRVYKFCIFH